uniref:Uncharacterized protein n=1 Tax=uncultured marine thaumarchaeote KM3_90_C11 TaxID=1456342 RepID=A0A075I3K4_9ARCH|nr:hypothetical protein [uncultured marine thaumarchaeote KM3_90_C11]
MSNLALDIIRMKVVYQNTVDIWIAICQEQNVDWNNTETYKKFIAYLLHTELTMKKFPLCIKESGGNFERGQDKTEFGEKLSESNDENSAVYTIKLNDIAINIIRAFKS